MTKALPNRDSNADAIVIGESFAFGRFARRNAAAEVPPHGMQAGLLAAD